ncbi:hypothetical protein ACE198_24665 [Neobacillus sp. KR4-4]|uniref:hypothetical protein n=1 Tax=Neobacillus sp. KR4-4 TaxID=3344872 RepID=UPI0035CA53C0
MNLEIELKKKIISNVEELVSLKCKQIQSDFKLNMIEFNLDDPDLKQNLSRISSSAGIYFFEADMSKFYDSRIDSMTKIDSKIRDNFLSGLEDIWQKYKKGNTPSFSIKKAKNFFNLRRNLNSFKNGWVPLYIGKINNSDANEDVPRGINGRVLEHIFGTSNSG